VGPAPNAPDKGRAKCGFFVKNDDSTTYLCAESENHRDSKIRYPLPSVPASSLLTSTRELSMMIMHLYGTNKPNPAAAVKKEERTCSLFLSRYFSLSLSISMSLSTLAE
jgi:hypothetical protein